MFGIIIAMPTEARCFSSSFREIGKIYKLSDKTLVIVSGMGKQAIEAVETLLQHGATSLISCGSAAGLSPHLKSGTLCIPQKIINAQGETCYCDPGMQEQVLKNLDNKITVSQGNLAHAINILKTQTEKKDLYQISGAEVADMESFYIGQEAQRHQIPFIALRVIIDTFDFDMPERLTQCISIEGRVSIRKILINLCKQPRLLLSLLLLGNNFHKTRKALKNISQIDMFTT